MAQLNEMQMSCKRAAKTYVPYHLTERLSQIPVVLDDQHLCHGSAPPIVAKRFVAKRSSQTRATARSRPPESRDRTGPSVRAYGARCAALVRDGSGMSE